MDKAVIIGIGGPIGVGKSTFLNNVESDRVLVFREPAEENEMLALFYQNPGRFAAAMQFCTLCHRIRTTRAALAAAATATRHGTALTVVVERPFPEDYAFVLANFRAGTFPADAFADYFLLISDMFKELPLPNVMVRIDAPAKECIFRISTRGRACETGIGVEYMDHVHEGYEVIFALCRRMGVPCMTVDWSAFGDPHAVLAAAVADARPQPHAWDESRLDKFEAEAFRLYTHYLELAGETTAHVLAMHADRMLLKPSQK